MASLLLIDKLINTFKDNKYIQTAKLKTDHNKEECNEIEEQILSKTLNNKSIIYITNTDNLNKQLPAKNTATGITAKLRVTNKSLQIYYPQPIIFDTSATQKSKGSRLATDMNLKTHQDEIIFNTKLTDISSYNISIENKSDNIIIKCSNSTQCIFTLSKWSAKSLHDSLAKI
eukprot:346107_1